MTGFDETVPPPEEDSPDADATAASDNDLDENRPEHDSSNPALEDDADPDEPESAGR